MTAMDSGSDANEELFEAGRGKAAAEIHERARLYSESRVYKLNNQYLDERQKLDIEMWFVAPMELFYVAAAIFMLLKQTPLESVLLSSVISIALMETFFWNAKSRLFYPYHRTILRLVKGHVLVLVLFLCSVLFAGAPWWAASALSFMYLLTSFSPSIISSVILHGTRMHPKYEFAKRRFNLQYPWDSMGV